MLSGGHASYIIYVSHGWLILRQKLSLRCRSIGKEGPGSGGRWGCAAADVAAPSSLPCCLGPLPLPLCQKSLPAAVAAAAERKGQGPDDSAAAVVVEWKGQGPNWNAAAAALTRPRRPLPHKKSEGSEKNKDIYVTLSIKEIE